MGLSQTCPWSLPTAPPPGWELKTPTWSSIFRCSWTTLFSMPTLRRFRCSAERASILRAFSSRLALSLRKPHWMTMAAPRSRWKHLRASQLRTCFWMMVALCSLRTWQGTSTHLVGLHCRTGARGSCTALGREPRSARDSLPMA